MTVRGFEVALGSLTRILWLRHPRESENISRSSSGDSPRTIMYMSDWKTSSSPHVVDPGALGGCDSE